MMKLVRALFDYHASDAANLSFVAGDLIQVFTMLESGWWDGLCNNQRGWFPSNFVTPISIRSHNEEAAWIQKAAEKGESTPSKEFNDVIVLPPHWSIQTSTDHRHSYFLNEQTLEKLLVLPPKSAYKTFSDKGHPQISYLQSNFKLYTSSSSSFSSPSASIPEAPSTQLLSSLTPPSIVSNSDSMPSNVVSTNFNSSNPSDPLLTSNSKTSDGLDTSQTDITQITMTPMNTPVLSNAKNKNVSSPFSHSSLNATSNRVSDLSFHSVDTTSPFTAEPTMASLSPPPPMTSSPPTLPPPLTPATLPSNHLLNNSSSFTSVSSALVAPAHSSIAEPNLSSSSLVNASSNSFSDPSLDSSTFSKESARSSKDRKLDSAIDSSYSPPVPLSPTPSSISKSEMHLSTVSSSSSSSSSASTSLSMNDSPTSLFPTVSLLPFTSYSNLTPAERQMQSWALLTQQIFSSIQNLHKAAKDNLKHQYIMCSSKIVDTIRSMLVASKAADKDSPVIKNNPPLKSRHRGLLGSLSKLVLSAKLASGVWPPPDAAQKMIMDASELLSCVKKFVEIARDSGVEVSTDIIEQHQQAFAALEATSPLIPNDSNSSLSNNEASTSRRPSLPTNIHSTSVMSTMSSASSTSSTISSNSTNSSIKSVPLSECILQQLDTLTHNVIDTLKKLKDQAHQSISVATLISLTRNAVTQVGQFLSLIEDIHLEKGPDCPLLNDFKVSKQSLYNNIAGLVMATQTVTASMPPSNAIDQVLLSINIVEKSVTEVLAATRQLLSPHSSQSSTSDTSSSEALRKDTLVPSEAPSTPMKPSITPKSHLVLNTALANSFLPPGQTSEITWEQFPALIETAAHQMESSNKFSNLTSSPSGGLSFSTSSSSPPSTPASIKLRKFFGDDADVASKEAFSLTSQRNKDDTPWFLQADYQPCEIIFNLEGQIKGGTIPALIERLTMHNKYDPAFTSAFLLTYRTFMTTQDLFDALVQRFSIQPPEGLTTAEYETWIEKKMTPIRLRVFNVLKSWLENYCLPYIPDDQQLLEPMRQFARCVVRPVMSLLSISMIKLIEKREASPTPHLPLRGPQPTTPVTHASTQNSFPSPLVPRNLNKLKFVDLDPLEIARQLTLIEFSLFSRIIYTEFLNKAWSSDRGVSDSEARARAPNLRRMIEMSNRVTCWVADTILAEEDPRRRCALVKHFVNIANHCKQLNNFNSLFAILAALHSAPIHRLSRTWDMVSPKVLLILDELTGIIDPHKNFHIYRNLLHSITPPCIPFLGRYLSDLTFLEDGQPNLLTPMAQDPNLLLINFGKRFQIADIIREVQQYQIVPFHLKPVPEIQSLLMEQIDRISGETSSLYEVSLNLEPQEREDEKLVRLLEESGLL